MLHSELCEICQARLYVGLLNAPKPDLPPEEDTGASHQDIYLLPATAITGFSGNIQSEHCNNPPRVKAHCVNFLSPTWMGDKKLFLFTD